MQYPDTVQATRRELNGAIRTHMIHRSVTANPDIFPPQTCPHILFVGSQTNLVVPGILPGAPVIVLDVNRPLELTGWPAIMHVMASGHRENSYKYLGLFAARFLPKGEDQVPPDLWDMLPEEASSYRQQCMTLESYI